MALTVTNWTHHKSIVMFDFNFILDPHHHGYTSYSSLRPSPVIKDQQAVSV